MVNANIIKCIALSMYLLVAGCSNPMVGSNWYLRWTLYSGIDSSAYKGTYTVSIYPNPDLWDSPFILNPRSGVFNQGFDVDKTAEEMFNGTYYLDIKMRDTNNAILLDTSILWKDLNFKSGFINYNNGTGDHPVDYLSSKTFYIKSSKSEIVEAK